MLFRNLGNDLSSELIRTAVVRTREEWQRRYGNLPSERLRTEVDIGKVCSKNPGCCYKKAGWIVDRIVRGKLYLLAPLVCLFLLAFPARAAEVTPELVCTVQGAVRWRVPPWEPQLCADVSSALFATAEPDLLLAQIVLESQMRPRAIHWVRFRGRTTVPVCRRADGPRCYSSARAFREWSAGARPVPGDVLDGGLCAVRCVVGRGGTCRNGPARGATIEQLLDPATNIRIAAQVLESKRMHFGRRYLGAYNGDPNDRRGYASNVRAVRAAIAGRQAKARSARAAELARMIRAAVRMERKS